MGKLVRLQGLKRAIFSGARREARMRSNVETRRCGCGVILGLREGCQRCADAARAKLHARGVGKLECRRGYSDYGNGTWLPEAAQDEARTQRAHEALFGVQQSTRPNELHGTMVTEDNIRDAMRAVYGEKSLQLFDAAKACQERAAPDPRTKAGSSPLSQACAAAEEARRLTGVVPYAVATPRPERDMLYWQESRRIDWLSPPTEPVVIPQHRCYWERCGDGPADAGYVQVLRDKCWWSWRVVGGVIVFDEAERMVREHDGRKAGGEKHEPPAVGAEVSYEPENARWVRLA